MFKRHDLDRDSLDFWRRQRRAAQRSRGRGGFPYGSSGNRATIALIALCVIGTFLPSSLLASVYALPAGMVWLALVSTVIPGGLLGLIFIGLFIWMLGSQIEPLDATWKYVVLFLVSGTLGSLAGDLVAGGLMLGSVAAFGLAGGYAYVMWAHQWADQGGVWRWVLGLLVLNAILSFQAASIVAMVVSFVAGFAFSYVTRFGG
jgi:membrane associated rhomboid family serine protease